MSKPDGLKIRVRRGGFASAEAALVACAELQAEPDPRVLTRQWTVARWLRHWLNVVSERLRPSTALSYRQIVANDLIPQLGKYRLSKLRLRDVQRGLDVISRRVKRNGDLISVSTVNGIRAVLRSSLNEAWRQGLVGRNSAWRTRLSWQGRTVAVLWTAGRERIWRETGIRPTVAVWDTHHAVEFLDAVAADRLYALWRLLTLRGLRRGEVAGLRWSDIDFLAKELTVERQLLIIGRRLRVGPPKSTTSVRTLALDDATVAALWQLWQDEFQRLGHRPDPDGPMFIHSNGRAVRPDWLTRRLPVLVAQADLPPVRLHDLRHVAASLAGTAGVDLKTIQETMGHSSVVTTADSYLTVMSEGHHNAAAATAELVSRHARRRLTLGAASQA